MYNVFHGDDPLGFQALAFPLDLLRVAQLCLTWLLVALCCRKESGTVVIWAVLCIGLQAEIRPLNRALPKHAYLKGRNKRAQIITRKGTLK